MDKDALRREADHQGREYSRLVETERHTFFNSAWWDAVRRATALWMTRQMQRLLPAESAPWDVLDVGCGIGFTAFEMARLGHGRVRRITGLDASENALALAGELRETLAPRDASRLLFVRENFFDHARGPYHVVYMNEVFEHLPCAEDVFAKAAELLHPGGLFLISTPNRERLANRLRTAARRAPVLLDPLHIKEYTVREMRSPPGAWSVEAVTGRQIADADALGLALSLGLAPLRRAVAPLVNALAHNRATYALGAAAPALAAEIFVAYRKKGP